MSTPPQTPPSDDGTPSFSDDTWRQFSEDSESAIRASAPKEPSARARQVTERLRRQDEEAERQARKRRFGRKRAAPAEPPGWRTGPAWQEMRRQEHAPWRRRLTSGLVIVAVAATVLVALNPSRALSFVRGDSGSSTAAEDAGTTTLPPETAAPTAPPTAASDPSIPTLRHPFAGSPAEKWSDGAAGIVPPRAEAVGAVPQKKVAAALQATRSYLVATNLDPAVLRGEYPQKAIDLIDPRDSYVRDGMKTALRTPSQKNDPLAWFTRYQPAQLALVGKTVKVRGEITFAKGPNETVKIHADYTFVYPLTQLHADAGEVSRTIVRRVLDFEATGAELWLYRDAYQTGNTGCGTYDGYVHPGFTTRAANPSASPATGPRIDPYDRSHPLTPMKGCGVDTRT